MTRLVPGVARCDYARTHGYQGRLYRYDRRTQRRVIVASRFFAAAKHRGWKAARTLAIRWALEHARRRARRRR